MTDTNPMRDLYARLEDAGISESYVRDYVLPDWWDDEIAESSTGFLEGLGYVGKYLGIDTATLRDPGATLSAENVAGARFKLRADVDPHDVTWAQSVTVRAAEMAAFVVDSPYESLEGASAGSIRRRILDRGAQWVSLPNLLDYCWENGIPVLHIPEVPGKKMDGMVVSTDDRPAIVLSLDHNHEAWLLFILAHELGHIASGHVDKDGVLVDEEYTPDSVDPQELTANRFAVELITGDPDLKVQLQQYIEAPRLASKLEALAESEQIDPGAAVLNFAHHDPGNPWPLANATLNELEPDPDAPETIRTSLCEHLNWSRLPDESAAFLARITGIDQFSDLRPAAA